MKLNRISLNTIGLNRIGLNRIGSPSRGSSSGSDRPYIAPEVLASLVAVVKCDGKSNNDPDRAIIKNLVDPDNPFVISNAAYKLNSGFGKYEEDFDSWIPQSSVATSTYSSNKLHVTNIKNGNAILYTRKATSVMKIKVTGMQSLELIYRYITGDDTWGTFKFDGDGIYELPAGGTTTKTYYTGFAVLNYVGDCDITIEQIPSFQGALVTDGVDDLIVSQKTVQEMLGGSNEITVVSMIHHITGTDVSSFNSVRNFTSVTGRNRLNINNNPINKTGIYGWSRSNLNTVQATTMINNVLGDNKDYQTINNDILSNDSLYSVEGYNAENGAQEVSQVAWYWTFIANRVLTTDEINQVIAYYNLDKYVKPDIYYDVKKQGLSNDTPDADWYLKDFSGNGRDMQLYNYGKTPESGINEEGGLQSDGVTDYGQFVGDLGLKDYTVAVDRAYVKAKGSQVPIISNVVDGSVNTPFLMEHLGIEKILAPHSFGRYTALSELNINRFISYQSTYKYNGSDIIKGTSTDAGSGLTIGRYGGSSSQYANIALWSLLLFPYTLSEFLLERQLKRYKLGSIYPDMVEVRPIVKSNTSNYLRIEYRNDKGGLIQPGSYLPVSSILRISVVMNNDTSEVSSLKVDGVDIPETNYSNGRFYIYDATVTKSPQKIDITIDEYIRYEDIVQPYPFIIPIIDTDGKEYTYGDKIKVGTEIRGGINGNNLLPELYKLNGYFNFNGAYFSASNKHVIGKTNVFELTNAPTYLKANEPNCIADPQRLRIPNSSYKILGYIPDISGHGNHLKINNSAYAGMSGANGYKYDWNTWSIVGGSNVERTDSLFTNKLAITTPTWGLLPPRNTVTGTFKIKVEGLKTGNIYWTYRESEETYKQFYIYNDGEYELPAPISESDGTGFIFNTGTNAGVIVRQIGQYEGSFCLDGVEDYLTIPTLSHGAKQVLMKVNPFTDKCPIYEQRSTVLYKFCVYLNGPTIAYRNGNNASTNTYIDGVLNSHILSNELIGITHNIVMTDNEVDDRTISPLIGRLFPSNSTYAQMALFAFMSFPEISTEEEIKELNDIVGIEGGYVESPDYYWDAYGKSNSDADRATIIDQVSKEAANALTVNNFAFNEESGYGGWLGIRDLTNAFNEEKVINKWKRGGTLVKGIDADNIIGCGYGQANYYDNVNHSFLFKIKITGLTDNDTLFVTQYGMSEIIGQQLFNGINEVTIDISNSPNPNYPFFTFKYPPLTNDVDFEFLYEYQNGLVSDGVEDNLKNTNMPVLTDYTWIMKRKRLNDKSSTVMAYKGSSPGTQAFMFELIEGSKSTRSFGGSTVLEGFADLISYQTKTSYNGTTISAGIDADGTNLFIFRSREPYPNYCKGVFYKAMLYSKTIDMLSINMLKNLFEKDELIDVNNPIFKK